MTNKLVCNGVRDLHSAQPEKHTQERTETHACDLIDRQAAIDAMGRATWAINRINELPPAQPKPHWIPCSERLPEGTVLVTAETKMFKHKYICEAVWIPRWSKIADFDSWEDCSEYNEDEDEYYALEGWYERIHNWDEYSFVGIEDKVIAWMPLPEPYAERRTDGSD